MTLKAAWLYDNGLPCGKEANIAKLLAAEAGCEAVDHAVQTHGGFGYAREFDVERLYREVRLYKIAPISQQMVLNYLGPTRAGHAAFRIDNTAPKTARPQTRPAGSLSRR